MSIKEDILAAVDGEWIAAAALRLVQIPSLTMEEEEVCRCFEEQLRQLGLAVDVREVTPGRSNLYARIPGSGEGPGLIFNGHLDTIPVGNCPPCRREGDLIYGRGSTDMKGGMAAMLGAARALLASGARLQRDLVLSAVVGHEEPEADKDGPKAFIEDLNSGRVQGDRIVIVEGRDALWVMSMGSMIFTIELESDRGGQHTQYVPFAENPIRHVGDLIRRIHQLQEEMDAGELHPLAGAERIDLGIVNAGDYFNRTPQFSSLTGSLRWAPGKTAAEALAGLEALALPFARAGGLELGVSMELEREPFETPQDDPLVQAVAQAHVQVTGTQAEYIGMRIVGDANLYVHGTGVPTIYYGPSNETAHADVETVSVERMKKAAQVYALAALEYCGLQG